jgi:putative GTP pyrophosphokinase
LKAVLNKIGEPEVDEREQQAEGVSDLADDGPSIEERAFTARQAYEKERKLYADFCRSLVDVLRGCLEAADITVHEITSREKDPDSFEHKAAKRRIDNPDEPKYADPLTQITDKAAVRIITYLLSTVESVCEVIEREFIIRERPELSQRDPERLGYASVHYLIAYRANRSRLTDFRKYKGLVAEIQVRTILQHAWAEIEHDIQYKAAVEQPSKVRRGFAALAGAIELADQQFQLLADTDRVLREEALANVNDGKYSKVEIKVDSVRAYLADKFGTDGPDTDAAYEWTVRVLGALGFSDLADVNSCVKKVDAGQVSRTVDGPQRPDHIGQLESVLLAGMGENYICGHPWARNEQLQRGFISAELARLAKLRKAGLKIGDYRPASYPEVPPHVRGLVDELKARADKGDETDSW